MARLRALLSGLFLVAPLASLGTLLSPEAAARAPLAGFVVAAACPGVVRGSGGDAVLGQRARSQAAPTSPATPAGARRSSLRRAANSAFHFRVRPLPGSGLWTGSRSFALPDLSPRVPVSGFQTASRVFPVRKVPVTLRLLNGTRQVGRFDPVGADRVSLPAVVRRLMRARNRVRWIAARATRAIAPFNTSALTRTR